MFWIKWNVSSNKTHQQVHRASEYIEQIHLRFNSFAGLWYTPFVASVRSYHTALEVSRPAFIEIFQRLISTRTDRTLWTLERSSPDKPYPLTNSSAIFAMVLSRPSFLALFVHTLLNIIQFPKFRVCDTIVKRNEHHLHAESSCLERVTNPVLGILKLYKTTDSKKIHFHLTLLSSPISTDALLTNTGGSKTSPAVVVALPNSLCFHVATFQNRQM